MTWVGQRSGTSVKSLEERLEHDFEQSYVEVAIDQRTGGHGSADGKLATV